MILGVNWQAAKEAVRNADAVRIHGRVVGAVGLLIEAQGPPAKLGELCLIERGRHETPLQVEVVGFRNGRTLLTPLGDLTGVAPGSEVIPTRQTASVGVSDALLGRVLDGLGNPVDGKPVPRIEARYPLLAEAPPALERPPVRTPLALGVRAIDGLLTCACGQRVGIFAGSGVGKSTLMGMIARNTTAEVNVIALIGERGREVREFIEDSLGEAGLQRSVLVVATSDQPAIVRQKAAFTATAIAEYFRDQGKQVLLMMDSLTRLAMAQREIGLSAGEPPAARGYTPSVFALMPRLLERAGNSARGSITALYTVLVDGDDLNDPIADTARAILDGHIVLSRTLSQQGHYPPIDVLASLSRVMPNVVAPEHMQAANRMRQLLAAYRDAEDLIAIGAYQQGANPLVDAALARLDAIRQFLRQTRHEQPRFEETLQRLLELTADLPV
ncbi:MAG: type III secretion system ATPase SctN [Fimbriimonadales bacterium]|nr:type III secretion system ATPase SctN [Fimbriimonadales bacterium]